MPKVPKASLHKMRLREQRASNPRPLKTPAGLVAERRTATTVPDLDEFMESERGSVGDAMEGTTETLFDAPMPDVLQTEFISSHIPDQPMPEFHLTDDESYGTRDEESLIFDDEEVDEAEVENELYLGPGQPGNPPDLTPVFPFSEHVMQVLVQSLGAMNATLQRIEATQKAIEAAQKAMSKPRRDDEDFADDEDDEPPQPNKKARVKGNNGHCPRDPEHNSLHKAIREHVCSLMNVRKDDPLPPAPTLQEIELFEKGDLDSGPSLDDFVIDYLSTPTSAWNLALTEIFVTDFIATQWENVTSDKKKVTVAWETHMDSLAEVGSQKKSARNTRRLSLYYRRLQACKAHPDLRKHIKALRQLGPAGMSSDESDRDRSPNPVYLVVKQPWRTDAVKLWLRDMDGVHLSLRVKESGEILRGHWPHQHRDSTRNFEHNPRNAVRGLPENFYSPRWLNGLAQHAQARLDKQEFYDLTHTDEVARIAYHWQGVTGPSNAPAS